MNDRNWEKRLTPVGPILRVDGSRFAAVQQDGEQTFLADEAVVYPFDDAP
jgi:hypothetical protein